MIDHNHIYLLEQGLSVDGISKQEMAKEIAAARKLAEAIRLLVDAIESDEQITSDAFEYMEVLNALKDYDEATKGE